MGGTSSSCMRNCCMNSSHEYAEDLLRKPDQPVRNGSSSSRAESMAQPALVPPVSNWMQAIKRQRAGQSETPRFEEVLRSSGASGEPLPMSNGSPRSVGGEFQTPRDTPRPGSDETGGGKVEELSYEGPYVDSMKHGQGVLRCTTSMYEGQFECDQKHGQGSLQWEDGRCYCGQFEQGKFHGTAIMTWPDGRVFDGQYMQDRKHGEGTFSWADGRRYDGQWVCGKRHGVGTYTNAKGLTRRGWWQNDRPVHWDPVEAAEAMGQARAVGFPPLKEAAEASTPRADGAAPTGAQLAGPVGLASELPEPPVGSREAAEGEAAARPEDSSEDQPVVRPAALTTPRLRPPRSPRVTQDAI